MSKFVVTYTQVHSPQWADQKHSAINCMVKFNHINHEVPFTAVPTDVEEHGRQIFHRCVRGDFGPVAEYEQAKVAETPLPQKLDPPEGWPDIEVFLRDANEENKNGTERGCVLVWTSMIDELLRRIIEAFVAVEDPKLMKSFFDFTGPAGSFSARTKLCYFLGLIAEDEMRIIDKLRDIRNDFAHEFGITLESASYASRCQHVYHLLCGDEVAFPPRLQFTSACARITTILLQRYNEAKSSKRAVLKASLPLDAR